MDEPQDRLTMQRLADEARREFFSIEHGFWYTAKELLLRPGHTMAAIWRGERTRYTGPFRFFMLSFTLYALVWISTGAMALFWAALRSATEAQMAARQLAGKAPDLGAVYLDHPLVSEFGIVLTMWLAAWVWFWGRKLNAAERFALPLYWYGLLNLVQIPFFWIVLQGHALGYAQVVGNLGLLFVGWATYTALEPRRWYNALRGIGWWLTGGILWQFVLAVAAVVMARLATRG